MNLYEFLIKAKDLLAMHLDKNDIESDDILLFWQDDRYLISFYKYHGNFKKAFFEIIETLKWRKKFNIKRMTNQLFPVEFYAQFMPEIFGRDYCNRVILWENPKLKLLTDENLLPIVKQFFAMKINELDIAFNKIGLIYIANLKETRELKNSKSFYFEILRFFLEIIKRYPGLFKQVIFVDTPHIHKWVYRVFLRWEHGRFRRNVHFITNKELSLFVNKDLLPIEHGGTRQRVERIPTGVKNLVIRHYLKFDKDIVEKF